MPKAESTTDFTAENVAILKLIPKVIVLQFCSSHCHSVIYSTADLQFMLQFILELVLELNLQVITQLNPQCCGLSHGMTSRTLISIIET